jgi:ATP/maltotriose-dependent transcriptional regulator MalT
VLVQQGKVAEALALCEKSLHTKQVLGDIRGIAVTQQAMADVLMQQGKVAEALDLYEQSLHAFQEQGEVRGITVTQQAMANVLVQQGKVGEALALYERSLHTAQDLGDVREVVVTQANMSQLLLRRGELHGAIRMAWESYTSLNYHGFLSDAQAAQHVLLLIKGHVGGAPFDHFWQEVIEEAQPQWLGDSSTSLPHSRKTAQVSDEMMQAVRNYVNAKDWDAAQQVVEEQQQLLFLPEVETLFEQNIAQAQVDGEQYLVEMLEQHLTLLRDCKSHDITVPSNNSKRREQKHSPFLLNSSLGE